MSGIKKLAGQTLWYGASSIAARFINYLLTPYLTYALAGAAYGEMSKIYAVIPFLNVLFTYGLETAYFRYSKNKEEESKVYSTAMISLLVSTTVLTALLLFFRNELAALIGVSDHPEYFTYSAFIIAFDTLTALAFAKLRYEGRPVKFALVRILSIFVNIGFTYFFLSVCPRLQEGDPGSFIGTFYREEDKVSYVVLANLIQSVFTFLLLSREVFAFRWRFNARLWLEIIVYSSPLILAGFAGMVNETLDRLMLFWWSPAPDAEAANFEVGLYSACYKLSLLITLSIQAFRMAAEPFFFATAQGQEPQRVYARVMKFFVIVLCFMFLAVVLFLDIWKYFISNRAFWQGLAIVPILLLANMFIGIYYNLSIWYKLTNKTMAGAWITVIGAGITFGINYLFIPRFGYIACAWATFFCYGSMMVISYLWGQKHYRVPYPVKKLIAYISIALLLFGIHSGVKRLEWSGLAIHGFGLLLIGLFALFIARIERKELARLPYIGRLFA